MRSSWANGMREGYPPGPSSSTAAKGRHLPADGGSPLTEAEAELLAELSSPPRDMQTTLQPSQKYTRAHPRLAFPLLLLLVLAALRNLLPAEHSLDAFPDSSLDLVTPDLSLDLFTTDDSPVGTYTAMPDVQPDTERVDLPPGCRPLTRQWSALIEEAINRYIGSLQLPSAPSQGRSRLWLGPGVSAILSQQVTESIAVEKTRSAACSEKDFCGNGSACCKQGSNDPLPCPASMPDFPVHTCVAVDGRGLGALGGRAVSLTLREWALQQLAAADKVAAEDLRAVPAVDVPANSSRALSLLSKLFGEQMQSLLGAGSPVKTLFDSDRMSLIIRLYGVRAKVRLRYTLEDTLATKLVLGQGSGDIEAEAIGLLLFDRIELNDFFLSAGKRGAIKNCFGAFGIQTLVVTGAIDRVENSSSPDVVVQVAGGLWSGTHIDTVACAPGSPTFRSGLCKTHEGTTETERLDDERIPSDQCGACPWTADYACPKSPTPGNLGYAWDDGSPCFQYCCCECGWVEEYACAWSETPGSSGYARDDGSICYAMCCRPPEPNNHNTELAVGGVVVVAATAAAVVFLG
ncbi:hypothetical protein EMIHUDRAFT_203830 [Emiliania huxleyi CCMP1516]|uniref:Uncharacterized protein n=2 Tax=Emiliania huxleyi TaxID=2903 RepID=A0A0D3K0G8_EMIH1|nr:hypothetical protein EMIHUDRAFT_203830 [Emiliania huxleyi CCMP1516]EOD29253.1 hypothetical protein EMIHUDRAFT_203830 [Emiliania huxleyi CCMP1516]|eukprot:XP_005781682.1 hypothetical protein EMIHUDRAFT_203830 [Emiliania huxleyi CCMP1516]